MTKSPLSTASFLVRSSAELSRALARICERFADIEEPVYIKVAPWLETRTKLQNRYLWGWLYAYIYKELDDAGIMIHDTDGSSYPWTIDLLHEFFRRSFLTYETKVIGGMEIPLVYSTSELLKSPKEGEEQRCFSTYVNRIKSYAFGFWMIDVPPTRSADFKSLEEELTKGRPW